MKIAFLCANYLPFIGGVETQARAIAQHFAANGHQVRIGASNFSACTLPTRVAMLWDSLLSPSYPDREDDGGIAVTAFSPRWRERLWMMPLILRGAPVLQRHFYHSLRTGGYRWYRRAYLKHMRKFLEGAEALHSFAGGYLGWLGEEVAREKHIPFVVSPYAHPGQWGCAPEDISYYNRADAVVALIETDQEYLASIGVPRSRIKIGGVFPLLPAQAHPREFREKNGFGTAPLVVYVGRMMAKKGAAAIVAAASQVWKEMPETIFAFIGPGTEQELSIFPQNEPRIRYLGKVSEQEKGDALSACDLFCMPSTSEILPAVYLEAWSYGKPVIGGMAEGLPELISGNDAGDNSSQDPAELAAKILRYLKDPSEATRVGENGRQLVEQRFSIKSIADTYLKLYANQTETKS